MLRCQFLLPLAHAADADAGEANAGSSDQLKRVNVAANWILHNRKSDVVKNFWSVPIRIRKSPFVENEAEIIAKNFAQ